MIRTHYDPPPIPDRRHDWRAVTADYEPGAPVGYGATEEGAIADLKEQLADRAACAEFARTVEIVTNRTAEYLRAHREIEAEGERSPAQAAAVLDALAPEAKSPALPLIRAAIARAEGRSDE